MGLCACICVCAVLPTCIVIALCALCVWCLNGAGRKQNVYVQAPSGPPLATQGQPQQQIQQQQQHPQVYVQATVPQ